MCGSLIQRAARLSSGVGMGDGGTGIEGVLWEGGMGVVGVVCGGRRFRPIISRVCSSNCGPGRELGSKVGSTNAASCSSLLGCVLARNGQSGLALWCLSTAPSSSAQP